ncbi:MAG TPA: hypothetical protein VFH73_26060, partial [Polyangia bacterium]|nr:hypothetical protein [Polyangia bacterium]
MTGIDDILGRYGAAPAAPQADPQLLAKFGRNVTGPAAAGPPPNAIDGILGRFSALPETPAPAPERSTGEAIVRGILQGATLGHADEAAAAIEAPFSTKTYTELRDEKRKQYKEADEQHPVAYTAGQVGGGLIPTLAIPGGGLGIAARAGIEGAVAGAGSSEADLTKGDVGGLLKDAASSGVASAATAGIVSKVVRGSVPRVADRVIENTVRGEEGGKAGIKISKKLIDAAGDDQGASTFARYKDLEKSLATNAAGAPGKSLAKVEAVADGIKAKLDPVYEQIATKVGGFEAADIDSAARLISAEMKDAGKLEARTAVERWRKTFVDSYGQDGTIPPV